MKPIRCIYTGLLLSKLKRIKCIPFDCKKLKQVCFHTRNRKTSRKKKFVLTELIGKISKVFNNLVHQNKLSIYAKNIIDI